MIPQFNMDHDPRRNFRNWLQDNFTYYSDNPKPESLSEVDQNKHQIYRAADEVLTFTLERSGPSIVEYYEEDMIIIPRAYERACLEGKVKEFGSH